MPGQLEKQGKTQAAIQRPSAPNPCSPGPVTAKCPISISSQTCVCSSHAEEAGAPLSSGRIQRRIPARALTENSYQKTV